MAMAGWKPQQSFNTSHVTLYRAKEWAMEHLECEFQYISCYSLSGRSLSDVIPVFVSIHLMLLFIRASTTSLTGLSAVSIHLMLLFIQRHPEVGEAQQAFQYISCYSLSEKTFVKYFTRRLVSIHLMLLFIPKKSGHEHSVRTVSIHLMLLFIKHSFFVLLWQDIVSIHLMLLFIFIFRKNQNKNLLCFNTSHVTLYQE